MTRIAPNFTPPATNVRSAVERPVEQASTPVVQAAYTSPDEFLADENALGRGLGPDLLGGIRPNTAPGTLPEALEPFREALDNIAQRFASDPPSNIVELGQAVMDAVKELGVAGQDFMDAVGYVLLALNTGREKLAQGPTPAINA